MKTHEMSFAERREYFKEMIALAEKNPIIAEILSASRDIVLSELGMTELIVKP